MPDYTLMNLREAEDSARKFGMPEEMSARFVAGPLGLQKSGISLQALAPNSRGPFGHRHKEQEEVYLVVSGGGQIKLDEEIVDLREWDIIRVPPEVSRQLAAGPDGIEFVAFGAPRDASEGAPQDAEMMPGWWSD
jgi:uncharacterized cupin superfamily protein